MLEYGDSFCCWGVWNRDEGSLLKLDYYSFTGDAVKNTCEIVELVRQETDRINALITCSFYPHAVVMPAAAVADADHVAGAVYRDMHAVPVTDQVREKKMLVNHLVPAGIHNAISKHFPHSHFLHAYTPPLRKSLVNARDHISVHFTSRSCRVMATKHGELQLAQIYAYSSPLDMVYLLLKIIQELEMPKEQVVVYVSGLIEKDSALFQELHAYFLHLEFLSPQKLVLADEVHPAHYFTSIANLAACVS